jgi:hypothetical protein
VADLHPIVNPFDDINRHIIHSFPISADAEKTYITSSAGFNRQFDIWKTLNFSGNYADEDISGRAPAEAKRGREEYDQ